MKTYLVEFDCCVIPERPIKIIQAENEEDAWNEAYQQSRKSGLSEGNFDMYCIFRN